MQSATAFLANLIVNDNARGNFHEKLTAAHLMKRNKM